MKSIKDKYFNVISNEESDSADIFLYGIIGQDFYWSENLREQSITDVEFVKTFNKLQAKYNRINIRINSPGGSIYHGNAIINTILNAKVEVHTYIDGLAASMASGIWLAAPNRHISINSLVMLHAPIGGMWGNAEDLREQASVLDKFGQTIINVLVKAIGMKEEEVREKYFDYKDHWFTAAEAVENGFTSKVEDYEVKETISNVENMTYTDLVNHFSTQKDKEGMGMLDKIKGFFNKHNISKPKVDHKSNIDMKKEDLNKSLENGDLKMEDIQALLENNGYEVTKPKKPEEEAPVNMEEVVKTAVTAAITPLNTKITEMENQIKALSSQAGDTPTNVHSSKDPAQDLGEDKPKDDLDAFNEKMSKIAETGENIRIVDSTD